MMEYPCERVLPNEIFSYPFPPPRLDDETRYPYASFAIRSLFFESRDDFTSKPLLVPIAG